MEFNNTIYDQIEAYIAGSMGDDEKKQFEKKLQLDKDFREQVDLHRSLKYAINDKDWFLIENVKENDEVNNIRKLRRSKKYTDIESKIETIGNRYFENQVKSKKNKNWMYYASVSVAVMCLAFFIKYYTVNQSTKSLYSEYSNWKSLPSFTIQNNKENTLAKAENLFFETKYTQAIIIFSHVLEESSIKGKDIEPYILSYLGASYLELNDYENALLMFNKLLNSNAIDSSKAYWYRALVYLKQGDKKKVKEELKSILKNERNFNFEMAKQLLKKLE